MAEREHADLFAALAAPFPMEALEWRVGATTREKDKGMCLVYVTNRAIMERLDDAVGPVNWRPEFLLGRGKSVLCGLWLRVGGEWIVKWDGAEETDTEPVKGGISGAMKRAAVQWGIGRYLYELPDIWAPLEQGKYFPRNFRPDIPARFLPSGSPPPASRPAPSPKPKSEPKRQQAKPQAAVEPAKRPLWDDFRMDRIEYAPPYAGMSWAEAWDMDKGLFFDWTKEKYQEIADDIAESGPPRRDATEEECRVKAAKLHLETMMRSKPK